MKPFPTAFLFLSASATFSVSSLMAEPWIASPEVRFSDNAPAPDTITGKVFHDRNGDGQLQEDEPGIPAVKVSNGMEVVLTDASGSYRLPVYDNMNLTVVQPSGWTVPVDERMAPRFFYIHKEEGTPYPLRFGGLPATGPAPTEVHFPLRKQQTSRNFTAAVLGDSQTYSNQEVSYFRDSAINDIINKGDSKPDFMLYVGDVVGDDLDLLDRLLRIGSAAGIPQWLVHGNHDIDFDARSDADSADSWRNLYGPNYYAFEYGNALFVVLDNVVYPCGPEDAEMPGRDFCADSEKPTYNGRVPRQQMRWLENLLAKTPPDRLIVLAHHIPFVSFADPSSTKHQTDNLPEIFATVADREALSLSGHTHTIENHAPGQFFSGWEEAVGIRELPFRHIVAGATSGSWYNGDLNYRGIPMSFQRMGAPKGILMLDFNGNDYAESYLGGGLPADQNMWTALNTPRFRDWYTTMVEWKERPREERSRDDIPPLSINDLGDNRLLLQQDLQEGVWITANIWAGSAENTVTVSLNDGPAQPMQRTQSGKGDAVRIGPEWADPFAAQRQLSVARFALQSSSGIERNQGFEAFSGSQFGPAAPQPMSHLADRNMHLWRFQLPADLPTGIYSARITSVDRHGHTTAQQLLFEVASERPPLRWRHEPWQDSP